MTDLISRQDAIALLEGLREQCAFLGSGEMLTEAVETITNMPSAGDYECGATLKCSIEYEPVCRAECIDPESDEE